MNIFELLYKARIHRASDLHIVEGIPPVIRKNGELERLEEERLQAKKIDDFIQQILTKVQLKKLALKGEMDVSYCDGDLGQFRINIYKQKGSYSMAIRVIALQIPTMEELGLPPIIKELSRKVSGLVLVTGPTGSGKSTTLASIIDYINRERSCHILTLEDPIEYLYTPYKSIVNQREIGNDTQSFSNALKAALRQDPDVIMVGEMRDLETIQTAIIAAETGHLVFSTLHTLGAINTVNRMIDIFPLQYHQQIQVQIAIVLQGIISQQLLHREDEEKRIAAFEIMVATPAIRNLIREGKTNQLQTAIQTGAKFGMQTMDDALSELYRKGIISKKTALSHAIDRGMLERYIGL
jgi:twitching motility protein PilT